MNAGFYAVRFGLCNLYLQVRTTAVIPAETLL